MVPGDAPLRRLSNLGVFRPLSISLPAARRHPKLKRRLESSVFFGVRLSHTFCALTGARSPLHRT